MIARGLRARSGITLTEILIAILIMGVGLISLATLFPLGLLRLREASRNSRAGLTYETAADDMDTRALFYKPSFTRTWYGKLDPFTHDNDYTVNNLTVSSSNISLVSGLPICYDPLWRSLTAVVPNTGLFDPTLDYNTNYLGANPVANEARFGAGLFAGTAPFIAPDPGGGNPSAYGLQRLTNFIPWSNRGLTPRYPFTTNNFNTTLFPTQPGDVSWNVFTSIDDIVFNSTGGNANSPSSVLPDMTVNNAPQADFKYTWFVTGRQTDSTNGTQFTGEVVVCDSRPFGFDALPGQSILAPAGETAVEAIFGVGAGASLVPSGGPGFAVSDRTVLLRWGASLPDPQVRVGGWICDVTYERVPGIYHGRGFSANANPNGPNNGTAFDTPFVRCNWYQIGKRTDPQADNSIAGFPCRSMLVTITSKLKAQTLLNANGTPVHRNVALVMPSVISVIPRAFEVN